MKSEWRLASNTINGRTMYIAYRLLDDKGVDHSGNREYIENSGEPYYRGGYTENRALVERLITKLNNRLVTACREWAETPRPDDGRTRRKETLPWEHMDSMSFSTSEPTVTARKSIVFNFNTPLPNYQAK